MKLRINDSTEGQFMKKLLLTCILIVGIVFIAGCIGGEKTDAGTPASSQISQESDAQTTDSILKQKDVPGREFKDYKIFSAPKSSNVILGTDYMSDRSHYETETKKIGEISEWRHDGRNQAVVFYYMKYDSNENFPTRGSNFLVCYGVMFYNQSYLEELKNTDHDPNIDIFDYEYPDIGDYSLYTIGKVKSRYADDIYTATLMYTYKNYIVFVKVIDDEEHSRSEAFRIAKLTESRLD